MIPSDHLKNQVHEKSHAMAEDCLVEGETDHMTRKDWLHVCLDHLDVTAIEEYRLLQSTVGEDEAINLLLPYVVEP